MRALCHERKHEGWKELWQVGKEAQESNTKPWHARKYKLTRKGKWDTTRQELKRGARSYEQPTEEGTDETCQKIAEFMHVVHLIGKWSAKSSCTDRTANDTIPLVGLGEGSCHGKLETKSSRMGCTGE